MKTVITPIIATEGRKFLETTTIRGVQRIVKSKSRVLFAFWLLAVLASASVLIWQLSKVFIRYSEYPVNTLFVQTPDGQSPVFPDITICNLCPLVHEKEMNVRYSDYVNKLYATVTLNATLDHIGSVMGKEITSFLYPYAFDDSLSPSGYFRNFPISSALRINANSTPVINCRYFDWDYNPNNYSNCLAQLRAIWDPEFYKCYTASISKMKRKNVRGFSAIINVKNFIGSEIVNFVPDLRNPRSTGIQVMIHAPGTIPDMKLGMSVSPGQRTTIVLDQLLRTQQPAPYSNCTTQEYLGSNITYSQEYCIGICIQQQYIDQCGCILSTLQYTQMQLQYANSTFCGNMSIANTKDTSIHWTGFAQSLCAMKYDQDNNTCIAKCFSPCVQYNYGKSVSGSPWPHISAQASFYRTYIQNKSRFGNVYEGYDDVLNNGFYNISASNERLLQLDGEGLIRNNFLQLNIMFNSRTYNEQKDVAAIPIEALGAQIGGVLSLWLGITIMLVFEIFEFVVTLMVNSYQARRAKSRAAAEIVDIKL